MEKFKRLFIGIPCYGAAPAETLEDYMGFSYWMGKHMREWEVFTGIISKSEQFRARNRMVEGAISVGAKYLLMLDDDMVIDIDKSRRPTARYGFIQTLIEHMEADEKLGIVGALYFQRGGEYHPVAMYRHETTYRWMKDEEIEGKLQYVNVAGGGCLLINMRVFDFIPSPWFEPEMQKDGASQGTDIQICQSVLEAGFKVAVDTSIELGHVSNQRTVITSRNRARYRYEGSQYKDAVEQQWDAAGMMTLYNLDVQEYTGKSKTELEKLAGGYNEHIYKHFLTYPIERLPDYYRSTGQMQLARQWYFHNQPGYGATPFLQPVGQMLEDKVWKGLDFGCGSSPLGFELLMRGQEMDFVDIDGASGYEFVKWRAEKRKEHIGGRAGFALGGPYDFILLMDIIEHLPNWQEVLGDLIGRLREGGAIITNYFDNEDYENPEHISMEKASVRKFLVERNIIPRSKQFWKKEIFI